MRERPDPCEPEVLAGLKEVQSGELTSVNKWRVFLIIDKFWF